jgi:hypothetical protein
MGLVSQPGSLPSSEPGSPRKRSSAGRDASVRRRVPRSWRLSEHCGAYDAALSVSAKYPSKDPLEPEKGLDASRRVEA